MGHTVTAIIAKNLVAEYLLNTHSLASVILVDDLRLIPLEDNDLDALGVEFSHVIPGFAYLSPELSEFCADVSKKGPLVYLETDYFGGVGTQAAVAFAQGLVWHPTPVSGEGAINIALQTLGVGVSPGLDEFDSVGLSRYRSTSDWKEAATAAEHKGGTSIP
jgi:hypothetical protein